MNQGSIINILGATAVVGVFVAPVVYSFFRASDSKNLANQTSNLSKQLKETIVELGRTYKEVIKSPIALTFLPEIAVDCEQELSGKVRRLYERTEIFLANHSTRDNYIGQKTEDAINLFRTHAHQLDYLVNILNPEARILD